MLTRVLIVDDEPAVLRSLERLLSREGFTVRATTRCSEALDMLDQFEPDVVIADFRMPEMDGRQLLAIIRGRRVEPMTPSLLPARTGWVVLVACAIAVAGLAFADGARAGGGLALACVCAALVMVDTRRTRELAAAHRRRSAAEASATTLRRELGELRERLARNDKLTSLGMMAAGVAHEINNPMSYVTSNVEALLADLRDAPALAPKLQPYRDEILAETIDGIQRVNTIVADLRRFAREDPSAMVEFDLNEQVSAALRIARSQFHPGVDLRVQLSRLPPAFGRPQQLTQVVLNLVVNAGQAIEGRGTVTVATRADPDEFHIEVRDTGAGMPPQVVEKLFQPFFTTKPVGKGTGLGLAVAHGIMRAHGGRIEVSSRVGWGTTFWIHLPRVPPAAVRAGSVRPANGPLAPAAATAARTGTC